MMFRTIRRLMRAPLRSLELIVTEEVSRTQKDILEQFKKINCARATGGRIFPHKPLLILMALGLIANGNSNRLNSYSEIKPKLQRLLDKFGIPGHTQDLRNPWKRLANDGVWEVSENNEGGFRDDIFEEFLADSSFIIRVAQAVLEIPFPNSLHEIIVRDEDIRLDVLHRIPALTWQPNRDAKFADQVLAAYDRKCAVCGHDLSLHGNPLGIDAAHIQWRLNEGVDQISNSLALCRVHHIALDSGAMGIDGDFKILVSKKLEGNPEIRHFLFDRFANQRLVAPEPPEKLTRSKIFAMASRMGV